MLDDSSYSVSEGGLVTVCAVLENVVDLLDGTGNDISAEFSFTFNATACKRVEQLIRLILVMLSR